MKLKGLGIILVSLLILQAVSTYNFSVKAAIQGTEKPDVYFGVDVAYENLTETKLTVDKTRSYTNLFVIGCYGNYNETRLSEICQYVYEKNMSFIVYTDDPRYPPQVWYDKARSTWGDSFLGIYVWDEVGGKQLDCRNLEWATVENASSYADAESQFTFQVNRYLNSFARRSNSTPTFTSDYGLYWYDYKSGYDTVFAEFGWNYSRQINVALCRGAAAAENKDWGVMITHTYSQPPYLESGPELFDDMVLAYNSGAKYIIVFDSNPGWTEGTLKDEHLNAMKEFWQYAQNNSRKSTPIADRVAYVLPENYAYGFRGPLDKIWGLWEADSIAYDLSMGVGYLLSVYGQNLDIVYEDALGSPSANGYRALVYWNDSRLFQPDYQGPAQTPFPSPTPTPNPTKTPTQSPSPKPSPSPTVLASPTQQPSPTSETPKTFTITMEIGYLLAFSVFASLIVTVTLVRKRKHKNR